MNWINVLRIGVLLSVVSLSSLSMAENDACVPGTQHEHCTEERGLTIRVDYPSWVENYPEIDRVIRGYLNDAIRDYLLIMQESDYDYIFISRLLDFSVSYEEVITNENIITFVFTEWADYIQWMLCERLRFMWAKTVN